MGLLERMAKNEFVMVVTSESKYPKVLSDILSDLKKAHTKVCYVCLNRTYSDVQEDIRKNKLSTGNITFVDTLSSHYQMRKSTRRCIFVSAPNALDEISETVVRLVEKGGCKLVIFDTISTLLIYKQPENITRFTNSLMTSIKRMTKGIIYIYVILKIDHILQEENKSLIDDLSMFAEKTVNLAKEEV